jgi:hypothetical protein
MFGYPRTRTGHRLCLISLLIFTFTAGMAMADSTPDSGPEATPPVDQIQAPEFVKGTVKILNENPNPQLQTRSAVSEEDRGGTYTNGGEGVAYPGPNNYENAKLAMAREAIEASRAAGTLMPQVQGPPLPQRPEDLEAIKMQALLLAQPEQLDDFTPAGVGQDIPAVQRPGTALPTDEELQRTARQMERRQAEREGDRR